VNFFSFCDVLIIDSISPWCQAIRTQPKTQNAEIITQHTTRL